MRALRFHAAHDLRVEDRELEQQIARAQRALDLFDRTGTAQRQHVGDQLGAFVEQLAPTLIRELIEWFLDDVLDELGTRKEVEYAFKILAEGSSAQRQLATYARTGDLKAVVDQLIRETAEGVCEPTLGPPLEALQTQSVPMSSASARGQSVP